MPLGIITKKHTRTADLWPFQRLHRSETRHPGLALVPDTHTEKSDSWLNAFRNYYQKTHPNGWPLTFPKVAQVWNSAPWISLSPWYTYGKIRLTGLMPLGIITKNTPERLTIDLFEDCTGLKLGTLDQPGVPDTHTEKSDSWLNAFRNYYKKHTTNGWPLTFPKVAQVWNSAPWISLSPWYTYGKIRLLA